MGKFDPESYRQYRPYYPVATFSSFASALRERGVEQPWRIVDLGCGTGHSALSWLAAGYESEVIGVDPDPLMLERARELGGGELASRLSFRLGSGEATELESESADGVLIGSAFHWMDPARTRDEVLRILRPHGAICIFEYQFPKAPALADLNEWVRRQFNLRWKAPGQRPRGDFAQVTRIFREDPRFQLLADERPPMALSLSAPQFAGLLLSQSRVLHYLRSLPGETERESFRTEVRTFIEENMGDAPAEFDFRLTSATFALKS